MKIEAKQEEEEVKQENGADDKHEVYDLSHSSDSSIHAQEPLEGR